MCRFFSLILTKDKQALWGAMTSSHSELLCKYNIKDNTLFGRKFVRIEITPRNSKIFSRDRGDWRFKVDEAKTLPHWYENNMREYDEVAWKGWEAMCHQMDAQFEESANNERVLAADKMLFELRDLIDTTEEEKKLINDVFNSYNRQIKLTDPYSVGDGIYNAVYEHYLYHHEFWNLYFMASIKNKDMQLLTDTMLSYIEMAYKKIMERREKHDE